MLAQAGITEEFGAECFSLSLIFGSLFFSPLRLATDGIDLNAWDLARQNPTGSWNLRAWDNNGSVLPRITSRNTKKKKGLAAGPGGSRSW